MEIVEVFCVKDGEDEAFVIREIQHKKGPPIYDALVFGPTSGPFREQIKKARKIEDFTAVSNKERRRGRAAKR